jgi:DeoR/GlpR family transcriptional regulator of sugar metabolism
MSKNEQRDLAPERLEKLRHILREHRIIRVDDLCQILQISAATARRDLAQLEMQGEVRRVHGGAVGLDTMLAEPVFDDKTSIAASEKQAIAEAALPFVKPNDSLFLDGGSTVLALAGLLASRTDLTVVTNSLRVAGALAAGGPAVILVGGELRRLSQTFVGPMTRFTLEQIHVDTAFIGTIGLTPEQGLTTTDPKEAYTKSLIISRARQVILLADSSKIGKTAFSPFARTDQVHVLITDRALDRKATRDFEKHGVRVIAVDIVKNRTTPKGP